MSESQEWLVIVTKTNGLKYVATVKGYNMYQAMENLDIASNENFIWAIAYIIELERLKKEDMLNVSEMSGFFNGHGGWKELIMV